MTLDGQTLNRIITLADTIKVKHKADSESFEGQFPTAGETTVSIASELDELADLVISLAPEQRKELIGLIWVGRGDYKIEDLDKAVSHAHGEPVSEATEYILGKSLKLSDYLRVSIIKGGD